MPYVPPRDRTEILDAAVERLACDLTPHKITDNMTLLEVYKQTFVEIAHELHNLLSGNSPRDNPNPADLLAQAIYKAGERHGYDGAVLGEFNYSITRLLQRVPQIKVFTGEWKDSDELRYWVYARTVSALIFASRRTEGLGGGLDGVFIDIKDEYKWIVNRPYEIAQIVKSGHCYDTPYYSRPVEVVDENGNHVGYTEIQLKRSEETLHKNVLDLQLVLKRK